MSSSPIRSASVLVAVVLGGCAVSAQSEEEPIASSEASLKSTGGGGRAAYTCSGRYCTCTGDEDCNDMFSDGVCAEGPKSAICQINQADVPRCRCSIAARRSAGGSRDIVPTAPLSRNRPGPT